MNGVFHLSRNVKILEGVNIFEEYTLGLELGRGNSTVVEAFHKKTKSPAALKEVVFLNEHHMKIVKEELAILERLKHCCSNRPFIKYIDYCITEEKLDEFNTTKTAYILMEKGLTSLENVMKMRKFQLPIYERYPNALFLERFRELVDAFAFLQSLHIAHCDIKPENIIVMDLIKLEFKICDVGSGKLMLKEDTRTKTISGTLPFLAPELIKGLRTEGKNQLKYNPYKSDVFSLGLVFMYIITNFRFNSLERQTLSDEIYEEVVTDKIKFMKAKLKEISPELGDIIEQMLIFDHNKRPDFLELSKIELLQMPKIDISIMEASEQITKSLNLDDSEDIRTISPAKNGNKTSTNKEIQKKLGKKNTPALPPSKVPKPFSKLKIQNTNTKTSSQAEEIMNGKKIMTSTGLPKKKPKEIEKQMALSGGFIPNTPTKEMKQSNSRQELIASRGEGAKSQRTYSDSEKEIMVQGISMTSSEKILSPSSNEIRADLKPDTKVEAKVTLEQELPFSMENEYLRLVKVLNQGLLFIKDDESLNILKDYISFDEKDSEKNYRLPCLSVGLLVSQKNSFNLEQALNFLKTTPGEGHSAFMIFNANANLLTEGLMNSILELMSKKSFPNISLTFESLLVAGNLLSKRVDFDMQSTLKTKLLNINLNANPQTKEKFFNFVDKMTQLPLTLEDLTFDLSNCSINPNDLTLLLSNILTVPALRSLTLNLENNKIDINGLTAALRLLAQFPKSLKSLVLLMKDNEIKWVKDWDFVFPENIEELHISLENSVISSPTIDQFIKYLLNLKALTSLTLNFSTSRLSTKSILSLLEAFEKMKNVKYLNLNFRGCEVEGTNMILVARKIVGLINIRQITINLEKNYFPLKALSIILDGINYLSKLEYFNISFPRQFTRTTIEETIAKYVHKKNNFYCDTPDLNCCKLYLSIESAKKNEEIKEESHRPCTSASQGFNKGFYDMFRCYTCSTASWDSDFEQGTFCNECIEACHKNHVTFAAGKSMFNCACAISLASCQLAELEFCDNSFKNCIKQKRKAYKCRSCLKGDQEVPLMCWYCFQNCHEGHDISMSYSMPFMCLCTKCSE